MRIAFSLPLEAEDRLAAEAVRHGHEVVARCSGAGELASRVETVRPDVALVLADARHLSERLLAVCDDAGVRMLALVDDDAGRMLAAEIGLFETAELEAPWPELEEAITSLAPEAPDPASGRAASEDSGASGGTVIVVWGPAGSPGRTTLAITIAAELAAAGHSVVLADADTHGASIAPALGMLDEAPGFAAACRLAGAGGLDRGELERIAQRYRSGHSSFWVLTGIGRPSRWPELSASRVTATIEACREWVDFTVVDTAASLENDEEISSDLFAPRRNAATITALRAADRVIAVGSADPVGLSRFLRAHVDLLETVAAARVIVAMNKVRASAIGLDPSGQVSQTLARFGGIEAASMIPFDVQGLDAAILSGKSLADAAPRSPVRAAVRTLVETRLLAAPRPARQERRGRFPRFGKASR